MEWLERMSKCIDYIEENITNKITLDDLTKIAYCSKFHLHRMFHMLTNITIADYIRNRRLTLAAQELTISNVKIIDVAYKYGYETPESFSKAFLKLHGISPSQARREGVILKAFPRIYFKYYLKGDKDMNYKVIEKPAFKIISKSIDVTTENGQNFIDIPKFWETCFNDGTNSRLCDLVDNKIMYGICSNFKPEENKFTYHIAVDYKTKDVPSEFNVVDIPASTWAIFEANGDLPKSIQDVLQKIYQEWFPSSNYEHAGTPEIEVYYPDEVNNSCHNEVWIPIIKKSN